jgi:uncharacterized protein YcnI
MTTKLKPQRRMLARAAAVLTATGVLTLALAAPAAAHVTVNPSEATQGGYAALTFRVPNETDKTSTTKVEVVLPEDTPIASVSLKPVPGWTAKTTLTKLAKPVTTDDGQVTEAVTRISWTANSPADSIAPGQFQEFAISAGPLPETNKLVFKTLQTYSDDNVVRWIEEPQAGEAEEPEHPAPTLTLVKGTDDHHGTTASPASASSETDHDDDSNGLVIGLSIVGLVAGLAGLAAGLVALRRSAARP